MLMGIKNIVKEGITRPFGDARTVKQAFPAAINSHESDPFLMCDYFDVTESKGKAQHDDDFPVDWHPHRGFDIASYLKTGIGRHGDSLGHRGTFDTPGMQWMSTGSGVEHAEGGANDKGQLIQGFQIWINVPAQHKMDDPRYGTVPTKDLPLVQIQ
jgi:redox-sensitive bicupin YhaK (pirin superfamily)